MTDVKFKFFNDTPSRDFFELFCGKRLGRGISREVYEHALDPTLVIKFETRGEWFQNIIEYQIWTHMQYAPTVNVWLAPIVHISPCGIVLIQKKTTPPKPGQLPNEVPAWSTDHKASNWGMLRGKPVMHDYGSNLMLEKGATNRLKKADWTWDI